MKFQLCSLILLLSVFGISSISPANAQIRKLSAEELNHLKQKEGVYVEGKNYNTLIKGHGTGLRPPTEEQWELIGATTKLLTTYKSAAAAAPASFDNSSLPWFPPVGNQASEGSCVAWAAGYYTKTFQEAHEHGWDLSSAEWTSGAPTEMYQGNIFSPDFIYHQANDGLDNGAYYYDVLELMENIGCCTWTNMPYSYTDHTSWPAIEAWREAPLYRSATSYSMMYTDDDAELLSLKEMLADTNLVIISIDGYEYEDLSSQDLWTADAYNTTSTNHANTIVGYDDNYGPYLEDGESRYGAFKVVNSWGTGSWENIADGFYYISYECMKQDIGYVMYYENLLNYEPSMLAVFNISHTNRNDCNVFFGIGETGSPDEMKYLNNGQYLGGGEHAFPSNDMALDVSEFHPYYNGSSDIIFEGVYDAGTTGGQLNSFSFETYSDYASGTPTNTITAPDLPVSTLFETTVYAVIQTEAGDPEISVSPSSLSAGLMPDSSTVQYIEISNSGDGLLNISLTIDTLDSEAKLNPVLIPGTKAFSGDAIVTASQVPHNLTINQAVSTAASPIPKSVLLLSTIPDNDDSVFRQSVAALPNVETLDKVDVQSQTPNTDYLLLYDLVIVASNNPFADPDTLGDILASYTDQGGAVITLNAATCSGGYWTLGGAFVDSDYLPLSLAYYSVASITCSDFIEHPITENVSSISTTLYAHAVPQGDGISIGTYETGGYSVGAYNPSKRIVSLNIFPVNGFWEGEVIQLLANSIDWFDFGYGWLNCSPLSASIPAGSSSVIEAHFDARGLSLGTYQANINIYSNDPDESLVTVPVTLVVDTDPVSISLSANPEEGGTVEGGGPAFAGNNVTVIAIPNLSYEFVNWTEEGTEVSIEPEYTFTAESDRDLVANFEFHPCLPEWTVVNYTNSTTAYGVVTIDEMGTPASDGDLVGAFVNGECRGFGECVLDNGIAYVTLLIQGESVEKVEFNIWDISMCSTIQNAFCTNSSPGGSIGYPSDYLAIGSGEGCTTEQIIMLDQGWNLISLYAHPDDMSVESIFAPMTCLLQVKDMSRSYDPSLSEYLNTLKTLKDGEGYFVNSSCQEEDTITGKPVDGTATTIELIPGWNLIAFPFITSGAIEAAYSSLIDAGNLGQVKSMTQSFDPALPDYLNTLKVLEPGKGYLIYVHNPVSFIYPAPIAVSLNPPGPDPIQSPWTTQKYTQSTVRYGKVTLDGLAINGDAIIGAFVNNECRGQNDLTPAAGETFASMVIHGEAVENVSFRLFHDGNIYISDNYLENKPGEVSRKLLSLQFSRARTTGLNTLLSERNLKVFPNPANEKLTIHYKLNTGSQVNVAIISILGETIYTCEEVKQAGSHRITLEDLKAKYNMSKGTYILKFSSDEFITTKKVLIQ